MKALELTESWPVDHVAAAAVTSDGRVVATAGDTDRRFRLASVTKIFSAWACLIATEEGIVSLTDPAGPPGSTLEHLLAHASGYPFEGDEPIAEPASRRIYSNTGFEVAAGTIAEAAGLGFDEYLTEGVLAPLAMSNTELRGSPAHGMWSTVSDVTAMLAELQRPRLIDQATADDATRPHFEDLGGIVPGMGRFDPCPWGLGMELRGTKSPHWTGDNNSPRTFGHFGAAGTMAWVDPEHGVGLVALTDRPFDEWASDARAAWAELSDAVVDEVGSYEPESS